MSGGLTQVAFWRKYSMPSYLDDLSPGGKYNSYSKKDRFQPSKNETTDRSEHM